MNVQQIMAAAAISVIAFQGLTIARAKVPHWLPTTRLVLVSLLIYMRKILTPALERETDCTNNRPFLYDLLYSVLVAMYPRVRFPDVRTFNLLCVLNLGISMKKKSLLTQQRNLKRLSEVSSYNRQALIEPQTYL